MVVMGVSASGKTTVGTELAHRLGLPFIADDLAAAAVAALGKLRKLSPAATL